MEKGSQNKLGKDGSPKPDKSDFLAAVSENLAPSVIAQKSGPTVVPRTLINGVPRYDGPDTDPKLSADELRKIEKGGFSRVRLDKLSESEVASIVLKATGTTAHPNK